MKKWQIACLSIGVFFTLNSICKTLTADFSVQDLIAPSSKNSSYANLKRPENLEKILEQKFTYLGKGKQAFVFASEDGEHVLKVFKPHSPFTSIRFLGKPRKVSFSKIPGMKFLFRSLHSEEIEQQKEKDFQSCVNSFFFFPKETELEYLHLAESNDLHRTITIFDKIGVVHKLNADTTCFLLQKKADLLYPTLDSHIQKKDFKKAKELLTSLVELSFSFVAGGIDSPTTVEKNLGCMGGRVVLIDTGRVLQRKDFSNMGPKIEDMDHCVHHMRKWLKEKAPFLSDHLEEQVQIQKERLRNLHEISL